MPTQADPLYDPALAPLGTLGWGTTKDAETVLKVLPAGGAVKTPPAQFEEYWMWEMLPLGCNADVSAVWVGISG